MLIEARDRFAERTAIWLRNSRMTKEQVVERLKLFSDDHISLVGEKAKMLKR